jgi:hypothetical protein
MASVGVVVFRSNNAHSAETTEGNDSIRLHQQNFQFTPIIFLDKNKIKTNHEDDSDDSNSSINNIRDVQI